MKKNNVLKIAGYSIVLILFIFFIGKLVKMNMKMIKRF